MSCRLVTVSFPPSLHHAPCAVRSEHPLAQLYCHSTLEHHHFDQCLMVLNSPVSTLRAAGRGLCGSSRTFTSWIHAQRRKGRARFIPFWVRKAKPQHRGPRSLAASDDQRSLCRLIRDIGLLASTRLFQVTPVRPETRVPRRVPLLRGEGPSAAAVGAARQCRPQPPRKLPPPTGVEEGSSVGGAAFSVCTAVVHRARHTAREGRFRQRGLRLDRERFDFTWVCPLFALSAACHLWNET